MFTNKKFQARDSKLLQLVFRLTSVCILGCRILLLCLQNRVVLWSWMYRNWESVCLQEQPNRFAFKLSCQTQPSTWQEYFSLPTTGHLLRVKSGAVSFQNVEQKALCKTSTPVVCPFFTWIAVTDLFSPFLKCWKIPKLFWDT